MKLDADQKARILFILVVSAGAIIAAVAYLLSAARHDTYQIDTQDSVSGLIADSPVEFHGVEVGKVKHVELTGPRSVRILMDVKRGTPLSMATIATITSRGLATKGFTGYVYVSLEDVGPESRPLAVQPGNRYAVIPAAPSKSVNLDLAISRMNENVQSLTVLVQSVLDQQTVVSLKKSVDSLQRITQTLAENNQKLASIIRNAERASRHIEPLLTTSNDTVKALQNQILPETHRALTDLDKLSSKLTGVATKIERDPSVLIRGTAPPPPGPGEKP